MNRSDVIKPGGEQSAAKRHNSANWIGTALALVIVLAIAGSILGTNNLHKSEDRREAADEQQQSDTQQEQAATQERQNATSIDQAATQVQQQRTDVRQKEESIVLWDKFKELLMYNHALTARSSK